MAIEPASDDIRLGPFRVVADEERVARYRREAGFADTLEKIVPVAFPAVWMTTSEIGEAIRAALAAENAIAVHESQDFRYCAPLRVGESYDLTVSMRREASPPRLVVNAFVATQGGEARLHAEALLRIVPRPAALEGAL
ncbi:hypothetical protein [Methylosinus sp. Sm6]|uniref:hypothetical protein n=1 Tax=Methylosinus sp. Sm6 TaxID=2866948 RepID=UPI001C999981|nr:hypothetical protein [Methylosinus sp. Sm6]MBY6241648.1 hypothetical protein [Methylosinus sp. Sm6]